MTRRGISQKRKVVETEMESFEKKLADLGSQLDQLQQQCPHPKFTKKRPGGKKCLDCGKIFWPAFIENE